MSKKACKFILAVLLAAVFAAAGLMNGCHPCRVAPRLPQEPTEIPTEAPAVIPAEKPTAAPKADIPQFSSKSITDKKTYDNSVFASAKVTMVNVWSTTCGPCIKELPEIQRLADNYAGKGLKVLTILGDSESPGKIREALAMLNAQGITLPVLRSNAEVSAAFPAGAYPTTYFIDSNGNILKTVSAANSYDKWAAIIEGLL